MTKILIAEDIPSHNKGEEALFLGLVKSLKAMEPIEFSMLSLNPESDQKNYGDIVRLIDARGITPAHMVDSQGSKLIKAKNILQFFFRYRLFSAVYKLFGEKATSLMSSPVWKAYCDADIVLMAHDSFFAPRYHSEIAKFCHLLHKPAAIYAGTTQNPLFHDSDRAGQEKLRKALEKLPLILLRENISLDNLKRIGLDPEFQSIHVHADLAFIVDPVSPDEADRILEKEGIPRNKPLVGMTMSQRKAHFAFRNLPMAERIDKTMAAMTKAVDFITDELDANILFIPHSIGPSKILDDRIAAGMIINRAKKPEKIFNMKTEYSVRQLKALAGKLDMAVGARLHFIIDALCNNVPSLMITHDGDIRCHGIIGDMVKQKHWVYNVDKIDGDELIALTRELWTKRSDVRRELETIMPEVKEDVYMHGKLLKEMYEKYK